MNAKRLGWAAIAVVVAGACLIFVGATFCAGTLHVPKILSTAPRNAETVELVASDGARLSGWWLRSVKPNGNCVVVLHGIKDSRAGAVGFAPMFLEQGYSVLVPDSRAHGASGGKFVTYGLLEKYDAIGWAHWMRSMGCDKIYGLGESLGASILIQGAALEPAFSAIAAECPYADLQELAEYRVRELLQMPDFISLPAAKITVSSGLLYARLADGLDLREVSPLDSIRNTSTPILLIHGINDRRTPPSHSQRLWEANRRNALWLVPGADHIQASLVAPDEFRKRVLEWFKEH